MIRLAELAELGYLAYAQALDRRARRMGMFSAGLLPWADLPSNERAAWGFAAKQIAFVAVRDNESPKESAG